MLGRIPKVLLLVRHLFQLQHSQQTYSSICGGIVVWRGAPDRVDRRCHAAAIGSYPYRDWGWLLATCLAIGLVGCKPTTSTTAQPQLNNSTTPSGVRQHDTIASQENHAVAAEWFLCQLRGQKVGHMVRQVEPGEIPDESIWTLQMSFQTARFGQRLEQVSHFRSRENADGRVIECGWDTMAGPDHQQCHITVSNDRATIEFQASPDATKVPKQIDWPAATRGYFAVEQSLLAQPMVPRESRSIVALLPLLNVIGRYELRAGQIETTSVVGGDQQLLSIQVTVTTPTTDVVEYVIWSDRQGRVVKQETDQTEQTILLTDRDTAIAPDKEGLVDIGFELLIPVKGALPDMSSLQPAKYRFSLRGGKLTGYFRVSDRQQVRQNSDGEIEVIVSAEPNLIAAEGQAKPSAGSRLSEAERTLYLASTSLVQSDHADIRAMAMERMSQETDSKLVARELERLVHERIAIKDYSRAFASALDVARNGHGDCTEHAVLLAALCRARGIPARGVFGLLALPSRSALVFHMWTEAWLDDHWHAFDATVGIGHTSTGHITLGDSALDEGQIWSDILPLMPLFQQTTVIVE